MSSPRVRSSALLAAGVLTASLLAAVPLTGGATAAPAVPKVEVRAQQASKPEGRKAPPTRPNVVVVMADDMRVDDLLFAPNVRNIIGGRGVTFDNGFSPYSLCCPARASFLTGQYAHNHKVLYNSPPYGGAPGLKDDRTLATALQRAGYTTGYVGKYLNGYGRLPMRDGSTARYVPPGWDTWAASLDENADYPGRGSTYNYFKTTYNINGHLDKSNFGRYQTKVIGRFGRKFVGYGARQRARNKSPFYLQVNYVAPHGGGGDGRVIPPVPRDDGKLSKFGAPAVTDAVVGKFDAMITRGPGMPKDGSSPEKDVSDKPSFFQLPELNDAEQTALTETARRRAESIYLMDLSIARLVKKLKDTREWRRTVLVFTSDNGYFMGEHRFRGGKLHHYEPSIRVPVLITGPGLRKSGAMHRYDPATIPDLTATIVDLADSKKPRAADGRSLVDTLWNGDNGWSTPVVLESLDLVGAGGPVAGFEDTPRTAIGIRTGRYSMTRYRNGETELYDLSVDPLQDDNVWDDPHYTEQRAALDAVWRQYANCRGRTCRAAGPASLAVSASANQQITTNYWDVLGTELGYGEPTP